MELDDVINLSLFYRKKKGLYNFTPEEVISIGYNSYLMTDKFYNPNCGTKKTTYFMQILEWNFKEEFRKTSHVKIPKHAWNKGTRTSAVVLEKKEYEASKSFHPNYHFDEYDHVLKVLNKLPERQKKIISHKYELDGKEKLTFRELARRMELSPQRVRMIYLDGLKKMKNLIEDNPEYF